MRILFYCWKAYNQADIISALRRRGHTVDTFELELGNFEVDENFTGRFIDKLFNGEENTACSNVPEAREHECNERGTAEKLGNVYDAVFSVNYFPIISDICEQFSETGNAVMVFGLLAIVESFMVFDMVIHGLKDLLGYV